MAFEIGSIIAHLKLDTSGFQQSLSSTSREAESGGMSMGKLAGGVALGQAAFAAAQQAVGFLSDELKSTVGAADEFGKTVLKLTRDTGMASDEASKLAFAFQHVGIDGDTAGALIVKFDKQVAAAADSATKNSSALHALGVEVRDSGGNMRSFTDILGDTADKINAMGSQEEKVAEVTKLFGRSGEPMLKFLQLGKDGMAELEQEAVKYGLVLSTDNVAAVQKSIAAHKDMDAAMEGIKIKIGLAVMPALTNFINKLVEFSQRKDVQDFAHKLADVLLKVGRGLEDVAKFVGSVITWFEKHKVATQALEGGLAALAVVLGALLIFAAVGQAIALFGVILAAVASPLGIIILAAIALGAIALVIKDNWGAISKFFSGIWDEIKKLFDEGIAWIKTHWELILPILLGPIGLAVIFIKDHWKAIVEGVKILIKDVEAAIGVVEAIIKKPFQAAADAISAIFGGIKKVVSGVGDALHNAHIPGFATGVTNFAGGLALVGERGPEIVQLPQGASVVPNNQIGGMGGGGITLKVDNLNIGSDYDVDSMMKRIGRNVELQQKGLAPA